MSRFLERRPIQARLPPRAVYSVTVSPNIESDEVPIVLTPKMFQAVIQSYASTSVMLVNRTDEEVQFILFVVPIAIAKALTQAPREAIKTLLNTYGKQIVVGRLKRLVDQMFTRVLGG